MRSSGEDQSRFFSLQTRIPLLFAIFSVVIALAMGSVFTYAVVVRQRQAENCRAALRVRNAVVFVLIDARRLVRVTGTDTPAKERFYTKAFETLQKADCIPH